MRHFAIDGIEQELPLKTDLPFQDLIDYLRGKITSKSSMISSVWVNGVELSGRDDKQLLSTPLAHLKSVEVFTAHPREVAEEALQNTTAFCKILEELSRKSSDLVGQVGFIDEFTRLIDGIETVTGAITGVKRLLRIGILQEVAILEADLLSILKDLLTCQQKGDHAYMASLLKEHLPLNLEQWRSEGIPAIQKSRDC